MRKLRFALITAALATGAAVGCTDTDHTDRAAVRDPIVADRYRHDELPSQVHRTVERTVERGAQLDRAHQTAVMTMRVRAQILESQAIALEQLALNLPLDDARRVDVASKTRALRARVDDANRAIRNLDGSAQADWDPRADAANELLVDVERARADAWTALDSAARTRAAS